MSNDPYKEPGSPSRIQIVREELFDKAVDEALAKERALKRQSAGAPPPISPVRRFLYNSLFYLPFAAGLGVLCAWLLVEPYFADAANVGGVVTLVNNDPFAVNGSAKVTALTIADTEVLVGGGTTLEKGADGQAAFTDFGSIREGDFVEAVGLEMGEHRVLAFSVRPATEAHAKKSVKSKSGTAVELLYFPCVALFIAFGLLFSEGLSSRNWTRMLERSMVGTLLGTIFSGIATIIPAGLIMKIVQKVALSDDTGDKLVVTVHDISGSHFLMYVVGRSLAWACVGAALGVGINLARSTRGQLRNSVLGGALGGAFGGAMFDPIDRFTRGNVFDGSGTSRLLGFMLLGISIGVFVALVERLAREAWLRVRSGPLAGKSFVLYRSPTRLGSSPDCDIYLFKDAEIDPSHAQIHRVGTAYEVEDLGSKAGTVVGGAKIRRRRLASGDQIVIGGTILEFEERAKRA